MTFVEKQKKQLAREMRRALRRHGAIRPAAAAVGLPRATFHDLARELGIETARKEKRASR